jgi:hypothetical protein
MLPGLAPVSRARRSVSGSPARRLTVASRTSPSRTQPRPTPKPASPTKSGPRRLPEPARAIILQRAEIRPHAQAQRPGLQRPLTAQSERAAAPVSSLLSVSCVRSGSTTSVRSGSTTSAWGAAAHLLYNVQGRGSCGLGGIAFLVPSICAMRRSRPEVAEV